MTEDFPLIPYPSKIHRAAGEFTLTPTSALHAGSGCESALSALRRLFDLPISESAADAAIHLQIDPVLTHLGREGYSLSITPQAVSLRAPAPTGLFYAVQTLRQLLPVEIENRATQASITCRLPCLEIEDQPRFAWRGFMLDVGRHFHPKETILRLLDLLALHKLNVFHWHLTEDSGWRVQIQRYPRLTEVGAQRPGTRLSVVGKSHDRVPHGGYYTQAELRQVVAYAQERHITIVPEIEMPGHSLAALAAYPELSCTGGPFEVATGPGIYPDIYCAGKEHTFEFLQNVLAEILDIFPGPFIHLGGDEAPKKRWKTCLHCQARMRQEGLAGEHALQVYFTNRMANYLAANDRRAIGWTEILNPGLHPQAAVQFWLLPRKKLQQAAQQGRDAIISSYLDLYLDHSYALTSLSRAYAFEPALPGLATTSEHLLGLEAPLWSEWVWSQARLDFQAFPRLCAYAETGWTPSENKDFAHFKPRLDAFLPRLDALQVGYAPLDEVEPPWLKQSLGVFTIPVIQRGVRRSMLIQNG